MKVTDVIEYVRRTTLNSTNLSTTHKRKDRSRLYHIVENDLLRQTGTRQNNNKNYKDSLIQFLLWSLVLSFGGCDQVALLRMFASE